jgi:tape measure domain-containing protein
MAIDEKMTLQLEVNMRNYARQMQRAGLMMDQAAKRIEDRFKRADQQVSGSFRNMAQAGVAAFAALSAGRAVGRVAGDLIRISDTYRGLQNQVNSASIAVGHSIATMEEISEVAVSSRASLQGTTMLYTRLERSAADLNMTQQETLRITQLVGMSFAASGATIQEQRSSILQLSQALQSGVLQGDELRSLREGAPEIARAIATEMGVGIGALKELGSQGLITSAVVMRAILNAGTTIEGQFNSTAMTVGQAMENMRTRFTSYVAGINDASNATNTLVGFIEYVSTNLDALGEAAMVTALVVGGTLAASALPAMSVAAIGAAASTTILVSATGAATVSSTAMVRSMVALRGAMGFLMTTPWGVALLAVATAVGYLALETQSAASRADRLSSALAILGQETDQYGRATERAAAAQRALTEAHRLDNLETIRKALVDQRQELRRLGNEYETLRANIASGTKSGGTFQGQEQRIVMDSTELAVARARFREVGEEMDTTSVSVTMLTEGYELFSTAVRTSARAVREATDITAILAASNEDLDKVLKTIVDTMGDVGDAQKLLNDLERAEAIADTTTAMQLQVTALAQLEAGMQAVNAEAMANTALSFVDGLLGDPNGGFVLGATAQTEVDALEVQADRARGIIEIFQGFIEALNGGTNIDAAKDGKSERDQQLRRQATAIQEAIQLQREFSRELEVTRSQFKSGETEAYTRQLEALTQAQAEASDELAVLEAQHAASAITDALYNEGLETLAATTAILREQREQLISLADDNQGLKFIQEQIEMQERLDGLYEAQISHELELARLIGNDTKIRALEREVQIRERIAELTGAGISKEDAQGQATQEADQTAAARQFGESRDMFSQAFSEGIRAAMNGDLSGFLANQFGDFADLAFQRLGEQVFDSLFSAPADIAKAAAEGVAQGTAASTPMTLAITAGGATAATAMSAAITAAGSVAAQAMALAITTAGGASGGEGVGKSVLKAGFSAITGGSKFPGKALGGPVRANQPYVVGEHGPELMIPDKAGRIVPRLQSGNASAMITYSPNYVIDARGSTPDAIAALRREMAATRQADLQQFGTRVRGVLPGALASAQRDGAV